MCLMEARSLKASGILMENLMDLEFCFTLMARSTRENSEMGSKKATGEYFTRTGMCTMASGRTIELMDMESSRTPRGLAMRASGRWTSSTGRERRSLRKKGPSTMESFARARSTAKESSSGEMGATTKGILSTGSMRGEDCTTSPTRGGNMKESS